MIELVDGLVLRQAAPADLDQLGELLTARGEAADAEDLRLVAADPDGGLDDTAVVMDGDRVVSTATLLAESLRIGSVVVPSGQVELVATDPSYEGRGLVRALMGWCHARSQERGDVLQVMVGIPYFYRQFGYEYAIPIPRELCVTRVPETPAGLAVRRANLDDIPAMAALSDADQAAFDVAMPHSPGCWRWLVERSGSIEWVVTDGGGAIVGAGRTTPPDEGVVLGEVSAVGEAAALALLHHAAELGSAEVKVKERPGTPGWDALAELLEPPSGRPDSYYVRIPDPVALLEHLRPVFAARAEAAGLTAEDREVLISAFRWHVRFSLGPDGAGPVVGGGPLQAPGSQGGSGVAPDRFGSLLFGPLGAVGLADREPDVYLADQADVMAALFPPVRADLLTFYLP